MAHFPYSQFQSDAANALGRADYSPKKLVLFHAGVSAAAALVLTVIDYVLDLGIAQTGGLQGIGTRAVLETIQTLLVYANALLLPFWQMGYLLCSLLLIRRQTASPRHLLAGFRHFGPVLRGMLLKALVSLPFLYAGSQLGYLLFMMMPSGRPLLAELQQMAASGTITPEAMMPILPYMVVGGLLLLIPVFYRLRMMNYVLMDEPEKGALYALAMSLKLTKGNCTAIVKLDLHFWWYYALEALILALSFGDWILTQAGVELGASTDTAMLALYLASLLCQLGLYVWKKNTVFAHYALAYETLRQAPPVTPAQPKNVPWTY